VLVERALSGSEQVSPDLDMALSAQGLRLFLDSYRENVCVDSVLYADVAMTLSALKEQGYRLAIVTNKPIEFVAPILTKFNLNGLFEEVLGGDSLARKKPDPLPLIHLCQLLDIPEQKCLMIGDSKNDILAAKHAKIQCIGLTYGYNYGENIDIYQPDLVVDQFSQLLSCLASRG